MGFIIVGLAKVPPIIVDGHANGGTNLKQWAVDESLTA
jgi:hypothetical protein